MQFAVSQALFLERRIHSWREKNRNLNKNAQYPKSVPVVGIMIHQFSGVMMCFSEDQNITIMTVPT